MIYLLMGLGAAPYFLQINNNKNKHIFALFINCFNNSRSKRNVKLTK